MTQQKTELTTARGIAVFPQLNEPSTKFDSNGVYECRLRYAADDAFIDTFRSRAQKVIDVKYDEITEQLKADGKAGLVAKIKKMDAPIKVEEDPETGDETGFVTIKAKKTASGIAKKTGKPWKSKPDIFDARGNKLTNAPAIGGGSEMKMNVELFGYYAPNTKEVGCSVRLNGVQVIKLVQYGARDAGGYGFGAEEDGDDLSGMEQDFADNNIAANDDDDI